MKHLRRGVRSVVAGLGLGLAMAPGLLPAVQAGPPAAQPMTVKIEAQPLREALAALAAQTGVQLIFHSDIARDMQAPSVNGSYTVQAALDLLLANSGLRQDWINPRTVAIRAGASRNGAGGPQALQLWGGAPLLASVQAPPQTAQAVETETEVHVSGSRINGPVNQTILDTSETGVYNYDIIDRADIERMGVTSMEELLRFVPQTSDYGSTALQGQVGNPQIAGGGTFQNSEVKLRGFSSLQTAILINGRRLQRGNLSAGADLSRIPVAAIERIEILPSSASAIYGGGAIGGAINVILRKDYGGRDLTAYVGASTDGGAEEHRLTYFDGRSFNDDRTHLSATLNYQSRDPLYLDDRDYLDRAFARYPPSSSLLVSSRPIYEQYIIPAFASSPGTIVINAATGSLGIPGAPDARFAAIPAGLTAAQASALTPASFTATAGVANLGTRFGRSVLYRPEDRYSLDAAFDHEFVPGGLTLYAELGVSYMRSEYSYPQITPTINLTAADPLNPFDVPISIIMDPVDLPDPSLFQDRRGFRAVLGLKGRIGERWEWSVDGTNEYGRSHSEGRNPTQNLVNFINSTAAIGLTQDQRRAIYNPLADHSQFPSTEAMAPFYDYLRDFAFRSYLTQANLRLVGDVFELPAGPLRVSPGAEIIWAEFKTFQQVTTAPQYLANIGGVQGGPSYGGASRRTESYFVEAVAPLIGPKWRPIPLHAVDLNFALRWEGTSDTTDETSPTAGLRVAFTPSVAVRLSYSEGFFPPEQSQFQGSVTNPQAVTPFTDPFRGNLLYNYPRTEISGGNPDLRPETSTAWNYGIVLTPRALPGMTLSLDYWKIEKVDAIRGINGPSFVVADPLAYPGRVIRAEPSASDLEQGWLGEVLSIDWRPVNVGFTETTGADLRMRYMHDGGEVGQFTFTTTATWTDSFRDQILTTNPVIERVNSSGNPLKWRGYVSAFWERGAWTAGVTSRYINSYSADSTTPTPAFPTATGFDGDRIPSALTHDLQLSYRVSGGAGSGMRGFLAGTQWTLNCENLLNKAPAYRTDRFGFYSRYENPRQRFLALQARKSF